MQGWWKPMELTVEQTGHVRFQRVGMTECADSCSQILIYQAKSLQAEK